MRLPEDHLRPPWPGEPSAAAYKDWLHLNVFDHASGAVGIVNASLHGPPGHPAARAVGTALVELPGTGWVGDVVVRGMDEAAVGALSVALDQVALGVDTRTGSVAGSIRLPGDALAGEVAAVAAGPATVVEHPVPIGTGWLGWYAVPRLRLTGWLRAGPRTFDLAAASGYADHNWGRWHWGENLGWEWGAFLAADPGPALVLSRVTDRGHRHGRPPTLELRWLGRTRRLPGASVTLRWGAADRLPSRRLPGALAALHADRRSSRQPGSLDVVADDGVVRVVLRFDTRAVGQVVLGDPIVRGYSFLHELVGTFRATVRWRRDAVEVEGLAVVERVE